VSCLTTALASSLSVLSVSYRSHVCTVGMSWADRGVSFISCNLAAACIPSLNTYTVQACIFSLCAQNSRRQPHLATKRPLLSCRQAMQAERTCWGSIALLAWAHSMTHTAKSRGTAGLLCRAVRSARVPHDAVTSLFSSNPCMPCGCSLR